ncbi:MAG: tryptophan--tRNA ligase [Pseudomonadota bacterium]
MAQPTNRVFSGVQPTGNLHLGNYLGAIRKFVALQSSHECIYCVVDLHAVTADLVQKDLKTQTREIAAAFIASGIDPGKHIVFNQSQVKEHAELAWLFNCVARMGWLRRMTQFKEKAGKNAEEASVGLFSYPNLMAADILLYRATHVPVGDDQKQHLELTREIAGKFNHDFAEKIAELGFGEAYFPITEPIIEGPATRVMSLRDGSRKMSKSEPSDMSRINLTDSSDDIAKKIRKAKTDPEPLPEALDLLDARPEARNLVGIYAALSDSTPEAVISEFGGQQFGQFKPKLAELAVEKLSPINSEMRKLLDDPTYMDGVLIEGADRARAIAEETMREVRKIFGFLGR